MVHRAVVRRRGRRDDSRLRVQGADERDAVRDHVNIGRATCTPRGPHTFTLHNPTGDLSRPPVRLQNPSAKLVYVAGRKSNASNKPAATDAVPDKPGKITRTDRDSHTVTAVRARPEYIDKVTPTPLHSGRPARTMKRK
ncbi:hypothetical protein PSAB6_550025 [Paraburkholderia sabiae]|nr:hypothetical protein PSAB6_550025 [Paraburkholderia sabiae]